jgi:hypothetical protein
MVEGSVECREVRILHIYGRTLDNVEPCIAC